jgi:hypothetical protein
MNEPVLIKKHEFESPINMEGSWGLRPIASKVNSVMELYFNRDNTGFIEWEVPDLDLYESIGLTFDIGPDGKRTLSDYDGVMTLPKQAMDLLEGVGIDCREMRGNLTD